MNSLRWCKRVRRLVAWTIAWTVVLQVSFAVLGSLDLTVRDPSGSADDVAHVILIYPDASEEDLGFTPQGVVSGRTWNLLTESALLSKGPGTYTLRIIHDKDTNAVCSDPDDEVLGTYEITFGGGIVVSGVDDVATATGGQSTMIGVLSNDLLVDASSFSFGTMPCPISVPDTSCGCSTYGEPAVQCPSSLTLGVNYVQGQFAVTVGDPALSLVSSGSPSHGVARVVGDSIQYTPDDGYCGTDSFSYAVSRGGSMDTATVTVDVSASSPQPQDDSVETPEEQAVLVDVLANDGPGLELAGVSPPGNGEAAIDEDLVQYQPDPRFEGRDRFTYTVRNACGEIASAVVQVDVLHVNHPPVANAGSLYSGVVGEMVRFDGRFSFDPDIEDSLQYRWDLDGDRRFDTAWMDSPIAERTYDEPFYGRITLEVRDIYRGQPTGEISTDQGWLQIAPQPPQIISVLFLDLDGDGERTEADVGLPEIPLILDETLIATTDTAGQVQFDDLAAGEHTLRITEDGLRLLEQRGYGVQEFSAVVEANPGEPTVVLFTSQSVVGKVRGRVFYDSNGSGSWDEGEAGKARVRIAVDGRVVLTGDDGRFLFLYVPVGTHTLTVCSGEEAKELELLVIGGEETVVEIPCSVEAQNAGFLEVIVERVSGVDTEDTGL